MLQILSILLTTAIASFIGFLLFCSPKPRERTENEKYYRDAHNQKKLLPSLFDKPSLRLSCIVPAFDESQRLPKMLEETVDYLLSQKDLTFEIIIVDDGSHDNTIQVALEFAKQYEQVDIRILALDKNRGKGGAVTQGMLAARGELCLMVDADGATQFSDLGQLLKEIKKIEKNGYGIAIGSRSHLVTTEAVVKRSFIRNFLMRSFHTLVFVLGIRGIEDTQCGFKLFTRKSAQIIFPNMHVERWIFDIECLMIAQIQNMPIAEVQVTWHEIDGSKVNLMKDSINMALDLLLIRMNYVFGFWSVK
ncbi:dolichyl-phosphate beta-glucosyltransferase [Rhizopus stolonifer]|uniref:dolichyl-phosphate beta-glucosyltransferase n=2 Tax=Mucorineae TaxID=1344963 RepID=A0A367KP17_RHIST|nr:dolichyl-phosphate beta-glucosyltransferase [Rhizopus stolonifer]